MDKALITEVFSLPAEQAWQKIFDYLWETFSLPIHPDVVDSVTTKRDKSIEQLDNILSGSAWELWQQFEQNAPLTSRQLKQFWANRPKLF